MTAVLASLAGIGVLAGLVFYWLWRRERRLRQIAEKAAKLQSIRAAAEREMREKVQRAEIEWQAKYEALQRARDEIGIAADEARAELSAVAGSQGKAADALNRILGHEG